MKDDINIAELLEDAPKGTKLYSTVFGEVTFLQVEHNSNGEIYGITVKKGNGYCHVFYKDGRFSSGYQGGECTLFPSKGCRTWENFKAPWKYKHKCFEPFQRVLVHCEDNIWSADIYSHYVEYAKKHCTIVRWWNDEDIILYEGNEDKLGKEWNEYFYNIN